VITDFVAAQANWAYLQAFKNLRLANNLRQKQLSCSWGDAEVVYDQPEKILQELGKKAYLLAPKLAPYLNGLQQDLIIFSPFQTVRRSVPNHMVIPTCPEIIINSSRNSRAAA